jgi:hypothetical protein
MLPESEPSCLLLGGTGGSGGLSQAARLEPGQRQRTGYHHQLDRLAELGRRQSRRCLTLNCLVVFQPGIDTQQDQRDGGVPLAS